MALDIILSVLAGILIVVGFIGTFMPVLPGVPLAFIGLLLAKFSDYNDISIVCLIITGIVMIVVSISDNFIPVWMTKKTGGSKIAQKGSVVGLIIGFFVGPVGMIVGPFIGSFIFEYFGNGKKLGASINVALGTFLGFVFGTGLKMITVLCFAWIYIISFVI